MGTGIVVTKSILDITKFVKFDNFSIFAFKFLYFALRSDVQWSAPVFFGRNNLYFDQINQIYLKLLTLFDKSFKI